MDKGYFEILSLHRDDLKDSGYFEILSLHRDDLKDSGYDTTDIDDDTMEKIAGQLGDIFMDDYWQNLEDIADDLEIPRIDTKKEQKASANKQLKILEFIQTKGFNLVNCPECSGMFFCYSNQEFPTCPYCGYKDDASDFPDVFYPGWDKYSVKESNNDKI